MIGDRASFRLTESVLGLPTLQAFFNIFYLKLWLIYPTDMISKQSRLNYKNTKSIFNFWKEEVRPLPYQENEIPKLLIMP